MNESDEQTSDANGVLLRLSAQRALLGNISARLRSASVEYQGRNIACWFVFDGEPTEQDKELLSFAAAEIIADYPEPYTISEEFLSVVYPERIPCLQHLVFKRHEADIY